MKEMVKWSKGESGGETFALAGRANGGVAVFIEPGGGVWQWDLEWAVAKPG